MKEKNMKEKNMKEKNMKEKKIIAILNNIPYKSLK
jgi:hypothetical protein